MPRPADPELAAIRRIEAILAGLDPPRRERVMRFIAERLTDAERADHARATVLAMERLREAERTLHGPARAPGSVAAVPP